MKNKLNIRNSLVKRFVRLMGVYLICFLIGSTFLLGIQNYLNNSYVTKRDELKDKQKIAETIDDVFDQALFDVRGYIAYGNTALRDNALAQEPAIKDLEERLKNHATTQDDKELLAKIDDFKHYYFSATLPHVIEIYERGNKEEVANIANNQGTAKVIQFRNAMKDYLQQLDEQSEELYRKLIKIKTYIQIGFVLFIFFILLLLLRIIRVMLRQIGQPLTELTVAANEISNGNYAVIPVSVNREDEIGALSTAFQKMLEKVHEKEQVLLERNKELNSLVQMKSELVNTVSHELRTPLASILGFTELLIQRELKPERREKYLTTIFNEAKRLTSLINDFLDLQRLESGKQSYEKRYLEIVPLLEKVIELQQMITTQHVITLDPIDETPMILGDKTKLIQVFTNLLSNAIKYSPLGGNIIVQVTKNEHQVKVAVKDSGLGIPSESIDKLFTKFYRVDNSDRRKIGGTGLGLAIVQEIMNAHEGEITVESEFGRGSTFTAVFPAVQREVAVIEPRGDKESFTGYKILVVEDDPNLAELISQELWDSGFAVIWLRNGTDTMDYLEQETPDAIVLDILLEDATYDGWKIMREMKGDERLTNIPIIVSTALDEKEKGMELGALEFLVKPYKPSHLSKAIMQTLLKTGKVGQILIPDKKDI